MKNKLFILLLLLSVSYSASAQLEFLFSGEAGVAGSTVKTNELPVFLTSYNSVNSGLTQQFVMKQGMAKGNYYHFIAGIGEKQCMMTLGLGRYLVTTNPNEARYADGTGRNISTEIRDASTEVGVRFQKDKFVAGVQFVISIRTVSIYSEYVFADGSKSLGFDHTLNGVYDNSAFGPGLGFNFGYRLFPCVYLVAKADYIFRTAKKHPEYHQFDDLQDFRSGQNYLPRDLNMYINDPYNGIGNSISHDIRGLRFGIGLQICLATFEFEKD